MATVVTALFVVSGLVSLAYEVVWVRALGLVVGNSLWAAVAVVAAYMGGMALGAGLAGRLMARVRHHLRWYGLAEAVAALVALATAPLLRVASGIAAHLGADPLAGWGWPLAGRFAVAWCFLALPTVAMGATLPLLVERVRSTRRVGERVARLYAANTAGAVAGVVLAGYLALPNLGERGTLAAAASLGLIVAGVAGLIERAVPAPAPGAADGSGPASRVGRRSWLLYPALFGFVALACELVWTRLLLLSLGSRVYAFVVILAIYLLGVAGGSAGSRWLKRRPRGGLALSQAVVALSLVLQLPVFANFGDLVAAITTHLHPVGFAGLQLTVSMAVAALLLVPTLAFGASFPLAVAALPGGGSDGARTGAVAAANTAGAIAGALAGPLVLVPLVGSQDTLLLLAAVSAAAACALAATLRGRMAAGAMVLAVVIVALVAPRGLVFRGAAVVGEGKIETLRESASATVVVRLVEDARGSWRSLELNGVNVAGTSPELRAIQRLQGHLPLLLDARPESVLHIGFGSGGTAYAVSQHAVRTIVIAEISPEVLAVSDKVFGDVNHGVLHDPRVHVLVNDGRNVLLATDERFDAILSDSIHPVYAGNSTLYTREYFALCRRHLRPGGVVSMWLPMYSLTEESFLSILRAFWEVFPRAAIWYDPVVLNEFTVVTGTTTPGPLHLRWDALREPALAGTLAEAGVRSADDLAEMLLVGPGGVAWLVDGELPHVDDFPTVEYRSGRLLDREASWLANFRMLYAARARSSPFARFPGDWAKVAAARDKRVAAQLRALGARVASR